MASILSGGVLGAGLVLDQRQDANDQLLWELYQHYPPPPWVKEASVPQLQGSEALDPALYGDPARRLFPCHTAPATWLSALYFHAQKSAGLLTPSFSQVQQDAVERRIERAARYHRIEGAVGSVKEAVARSSQVTPREALPDSAFGIVWDDPEHPGKKERHFLLRNSQEVQKAASYLRTHAQAFNRADRAAFASKILAAATEQEVSFGLPQEEFLLKAAGAAVCSLSTIRELALERAGALRILERDPDTALRLEKLASLSEDPQNLGVLNSPSRLLSLAGILEGIDARHGFKSLTSPDQLFAVTVKAAQSFHEEHVPLVTGQLYAREDLARLPYERLVDGLGESFADQASTGLQVDTAKLAELLPTLPRGDADLFERLARQVGITPRFQQAAKSSSLSAQGLVELASQHAPRA